MQASIVLDEYLENIVSYLYGENYVTAWYMEPMLNTNYVFGIFCHVSREDIQGMVWKEYELVAKSHLDSDPESTARTVAGLMVSICRVYLLTNTIE